MESALLTRPDRTRARPTGRIGHGAAFWAIAFAFFVVLAYNAVPAPLYGLYQGRDGFSSFMITVIFSAYAVGVVVSLFTVGHLSDWHGRRRLFAPALVISIASAMVFLVWRDLPGLLVGRVLGGLGVGMVTATASAWIAELHQRARPDASARRTIVVSTAANLGGIGAGPLVAGFLAQWVAGPLTVPYLVSIGALVVALILVLATPETRPALDPTPAYRTQRVSVPSHAVGQYVAAAIGAAIAFAVFGLFTSLASKFLAGPLHHPSLALSGATTFAVYAAAITVQTLTTTQRPRPILIFGIAAMVPGLALLLVSVWLTQPNLALFIVGGVITGAGAGNLFKGAFTTVSQIAPPERRAEALAGIFLAGYAGLSVPVVALGLMTQYLSPRLSLLIFAGTLTAGVLAVAPRLLAGTTARRTDAPISGNA